MRSPHNPENRGGWGGGTCAPRTPLKAWGVAAPHTPLEAWGAVPPPTPFAAARLTVALRWRPPANHRQRLALGTHALARERRNPGGAGIFKVKKLSSALLSVHNLQNFAHTLNKIHRIGHFV